MNLRTISICAPNGFAHEIKLGMTGITFEDNVLQVTYPAALDDEAMEHVPPPCIAILVQLILHHQLTPERLARISGEPAVELQADLARLRRMGLIGRRRRELLEIEPTARHLVHRSLQRRGLLP